MRRKTARFTMFLLIALLFTSIFIPSAFAVDFESEIKLEDEESFPSQHPSFSSLILKTLLPVISAPASCT